MSNRTNINWEFYEKTILDAYLLDKRSPGQIGNQLGIKSVTIRAFLYRKLGKIRSSSEAQKLSFSRKDRKIVLWKAKTTKICKRCEKTFLPTSMRQAWCMSCRGNGKRFRRDCNFSGKDYDELLELQGGKCALCEKEATVIDHDHETMKVRGLLCSHCNTSLGKFERDLNWAFKAIEYVKTGGIKHAITQRKK